MLAIFQALVPAMQPTLRMVLARRPLLSAIEVAFPLTD
jgi:hypothetical protein